MLQKCDVCTGDKKDIFYLCIFCIIPITRGHSSFLAFLLKSDSAELDKICLATNSYQDFIFIFTQSEETSPTL